MLLLGRVLGQLMVATRGPRWLPPMEQWQSGLLPYPVLLASQVVVLTFMTLICVDFARRRGFFFESHPSGGVFSMWFAYVYFGGMVFRYIATMTLRPARRWFRGTIPIVFHSIMAAFLWTWGKYQA